MPRLEVLNKNIDEILQLLAAIPAGMTSLDLSCNDLGSKTGAELVKILATIPDGETSLDLSSNDLGRRTGAELVQILAAIPDGVTSLDLRSDNFNTKTGEELFQIFSTLNNIESVSIEKNQTLNMNVFWTNQVLNTVHGLVLKNDIQACFAITPEATINEKRCAGIIAHLKQQMSPIADFTCGLLLSGVIESTMEERDTEEEQLHYVTTCIMESIKLFKQAAQDVTLKPFADFMLWHLKTVHNVFPVVQEALASVKQAPSKLFIQTYRDFLQETREKGGPSADIAGPSQKKI